MLTGKLTQDILENFFSLLRGIGGYNTHPGPVEAINRMRIIKLGKDPEHIVNNPAVEFPARGLYEMEDGNPTVESSSGAVIEGEDTMEVKDGMEDEVKQCSASIFGEMIEKKQEIFISKDIMKEIETEQTPTDLLRIMMNFWKPEKILMMKVMRTQMAMVPPMRFFIIFLALLQTSLNPCIPTLLIIPNKFQAKNG